MFRLFLHNQLKPRQSLQENRRRHCLRRRPSRRSEAVRGVRLRLRPLSPRCIRPRDRFRKAIDPASERDGRSSVLLSAHILREVALCGATGAAKALIGAVACHEVQPMHVADQRPERDTRHALRISFRLAFPSILRWSEPQSWSDRCAVAVSARRRLATRRLGPRLRPGSLRRCAREWCHCPGDPARNRGHRKPSPACAASA